MAERLLLVDHDGSYAAVVGEILEGAGYEIRIAANGQDALLGLRDWGPDLVILDMVVSQMEGWETCGHICQHSTVPILVLTGKRVDLDEQKSRRGDNDQGSENRLDASLLLAYVETMLRGD